MFLLVININIFFRVFMYFCTSATPQSPFRGTVPYRNGPYSRDAGFEPVTAVSRPGARSFLLHSFGISFHKDDMLSGFLWLSALWRESCGVCKNVTEAWPSKNDVLFDRTALILSEKLQKNVQRSGVNLYSCLQNYVRRLCFTSKNNCNCSDKNAAFFMIDC